MAEKFVKFVTSKTVAAVMNRMSEDMWRGYADAGDLDQVSDFEDEHGGESAVLWQPLSYDHDLEVFRWDEKWERGHPWARVPADGENFPMIYVRREESSFDGWSGHPMDRVQYVDFRYALPGVSGADLPRMTATRLDEDGHFLLEFIPPEAFASGRGHQEYLVWKEAPSLR